MGVRAADVAHAATASGLRATRPEPGRVARTQHF
jgi:hypothetical protein